MKVAITGHTSGIGKALFDLFKEKGHEVIGFSRRNGYDISKVQDREKIIETSKEFDIFVNNAYNNYDDSQLEMLKMCVNANFDLIINISSRYTKDSNVYCSTKQKLDDFCNDLIYDNTHIMNIKPGLINTPRVENQSGNKIEPREVAELIAFFVENKKIKMHSLCFGSK